MFYEYVNILNKGQGDISIINSCKWFQYFPTSEKYLLMRIFYVKVKKNNTFFNVKVMKICMVYD